MRRTGEFASRWKRVVSFTPRPLKPAAKELAVLVSQEIGWDPE